MMNVYFKKNFVFLWCVVLFLLLFCPIANISEEGDDDQYDGYAKKSIIIFRDIDDKYWLLKAGDGKLFFPLPLDSRAWLGMPEWQALSKKFSAYFPFDDLEKAKGFQEDIGFTGTAVDGDWGKGSWMKMGSFIKKTVAIDSVLFSIGAVKFIFKSSAEDLPFNPPAYNETPQFFENLHRLGEKYNAEKKLDKVVLPSKIEIFSFKNAKKYLSWLPELKQDYDIKVDIPVKYVAGVEIKDAEIHVERIAGVYPGIITIPITIQHKKFPDIFKNLDMFVHFPGKPLSVIITEFVYGYAPFVTFIILFVLFFLLFMFIKGRPTGDKKGGKQFLKFSEEIKDKITLMYESGNLYEGLKEDINKTLGDTLAKIPNQQNYKGGEKVWRTDNPIVVEVLNNLSIINKYIEKTREREDLLANFLLNVHTFLERPVENLQGPPQGPPQADPKKTKAYAEEIKSKERKDILDNMYEEIEKRVIADRQEVFTESKKVKNLLKHSKQILQPFKDDEDMNHFLSEEFRDEDTEQQDEFVNMLSDRIRSLEIRMPLYLKMVEDQRQRASLITENLLKPKDHSLDKYNLKRDIDDLAGLLKKDYLGENGKRPDWTDYSPFSASNDKVKLREDFWLKIWNEAELGLAIQFSQKILFKLKLILKDKGSIAKDTFFEAYKMAMAAEAVLFILQSIALSCGYLYHVVEPGHKLNLNFSSTEGDLSLLKDKVYKSIYDRYNWQHEDIYDVSYWGLSEIWKGGLRRIKESRVVVHYDKERNE